MKRRYVGIVASLLALAVPLASGELFPQSLVAEERSWTKVLEDRAQRGKLHDAAQLIRGDSGRWQDEERWLHAPAPDNMVTRFSLDDWVDQWSQKKFAATDADENWLLFSTRQLSDHDRVWVERVERRGNRLTIYVNQATWRGKYFKNFTYYQVFGINVGKLEPGNYEATCILQSLTFTTFDGTGKPQENGTGRPQINWPKEEQPAERKPQELSATFTVVKGSR